MDLQKICLVATMKKYINDPNNVVDESIEGYFAAYPQYVRKL